MKIILITFLYCFALYGQDVLIKTGYLSSSESLELKALLYQNRIPSQLVNDPDFINRIKILNPRIRDFNHIRPFERLYIEIPAGVKLAERPNPLTPQIKTGYLYPSASGRSLNAVLEEDAGLPKKLLNDRDFIANTKKMNPALNDFGNIPATELIYLEIPYDTKLHPKSSFVEAVNITELEYKPQKREKRKEGVYSFFYTASKGDFVENNDGRVATSNQDSPFTLGFSTVLPIREELFYSGSIYVSQLDAGNVNQEKKINIPLEYGVTSYANWQRGWPVTPYFGADLESFSTLNVDEATSEEEIDVRKHNFLYLTAGISKSFKLLGRTLLFKTSGSRTIFSNTDYQGDISSNLYEGFKYIVFFATKIKDNWSAHMFYKRHEMTGSTDLTISRTGVGFGYTFQ